MADRPPSRRKYSRRPCRQTPPQESPFTSTCTCSCTLICWRKPVGWLLPHVDLRRILRGSQQNIRGPVPKGHHLVGVGFSGDRFGPGQTCQTHQDVTHPTRNLHSSSESSRAFGPTREEPGASGGPGWTQQCRPPLTEIGQFEFSSLVDQEVLGLQVPVENLPLVTVRQPPQNLEEEDLERKEPASFIGEFRPGEAMLWGSSAHLHVVHVHYVPTVVHVLLQVLVLRKHRRGQSPRTC